jgi:protoporphyrinogen/coproporphyrinogen III oxidase
MQRRTGRILVVGAGLAGLAAAWRLSHLGFEVRVLEREARAGGRAASDSLEGFRFEPAGGLLSGADRELLAWADELGLRDEMLPLRPAVPAQVFRGRVRAIDPRGLFGVAAIPGVRRLQAARLLRLPRLLARYAAQLESDAPEHAAPLDDRSLHDFGRLYFGASVALRWMAPLVVPLGDSPDTSRALFLRRHATHAEALLGLPRAPLAEIADAAAARLTILTGVEATRVEAVADGLRVQARERGRDRSFETDALVLAIPAPAAARVAGPVLSSAEREGLARVRYAPKLALVLGLRRALHPHPRWVSFPRDEGGPLASVVLEPGVAGGRVPAGRGLAHLEARLDYVAAAGTAPDDVLVKELQEAFEGVLEGARGATAWSRLYRLPLATPRFDVGRYREIAAFERVVQDQRRAGRRVYFAGDYLMDPTWNGALLSGQRAARAVQADLEGRPTARAGRS